MSYPVLKVGSRGKDVLFVKKLLFTKGLHKDTDDDRYYDATAQIVSTFQSRNLGPNKRILLEEPGVVPGVVDEMTWGALTGTFNQHQEAPKPSRILTDNQAAKSDRLKLLNQLAKWYKDEVREKPKGTNRDGGGVIDLMEKFHGMSGEPWCAMTVNYAYWTALGILPPWGKMARVALIWNLMRKAKRAFTFEEIGNGPIYPGDFGVYLSRPLRSDGTAQNVDGHIMTITAASKTRIYSLDGNSDDRMAARDRAKSSLVGIIRTLPEDDKLTFNLSGYDPTAASDR